MSASIFSNPSGTCRPGEDHTPWNTAVDAARGRGGRLMATTLAAIWSCLRQGNEEATGLIHWAKKERQDNEMRIRGSAKIAARRRGAVAGAPKSEAMASGRR